MSRVSPLDRRARPLLAVRGLRDGSRLAAMQVRGRHRIPVIHALLTVGTLACSRGDVGLPAIVRRSGSPQLALVRATADVVQRRVDEVPPPTWWLLRRTSKRRPPDRRRRWRFAS
jgi:hypothetical protein